MTKKYALPIIVLLTAILLNSCSSVYDDLPEISRTTSVEVDPNEEYFTSGDVVLDGVQSDGLVYKNYWVYFEDQDYQRYVRTLSSGQKVYVNDTVRRAVKLNTDTGAVSSVCLDPVCNHSPGSDCFLMAPDDAVLFDINFMVGDWLVMSYQIYDDKNSIFMPFLHAYNLQTGEASVIYEYNIDGTVVTKMSNNCVFDNKMYYVKTILDYTDTQYDPAGDAPMSDFEPETQSVLCEFDFSTLNHKELYEVPDGYKMLAATNRRFFFLVTNGEAYSCNRDGSNMKRENGLTFSVEGFCGVFAYAFDKNEKTVKIYNLRDDKVMLIPMEHSGQDCILTSSGILYSTYSTSDRLSETKGWAARMKLRHEGTALIYHIDFNGSNHKMLYENKNLGVIVRCASDDYLYAWVTDYDPSNPEGDHNYNGAERNIIDLRTGEITPVPYLDLVLIEE